MFKRLFIAAEIRNQNLDTNTGIQASNPINRLGEMSCAAVRQFVSIDAGDHGVFHAKLTDGFTDVSRFFRVQGSRSAFAHSAEAAVPSADVAKDHECRGSFAPALEDVWAASFLTNSMQAQIFDKIIHAIEPFIRANSYFEPFRPGSIEFRFSHSACL